MQDIRFTCQYCSKHLVIDAKAAGWRVRCVDCGSELTVPSATTGVEKELPAEPQTENREREKEVYATSQTKAEDPYQVAARALPSSDPEGQARQTALSGIKHVELFIEPDLFLQAMLAGKGSRVFMRGLDVAEKKAIAQADSTFSLGGALIRFAATRDTTVTPVDRMDDDGWREFLNGRGHGTNWQRWFANTRDGRWNVVYWE